MSAYYNEIDPFAAQWLRELIKAGLIAPGDVDGRSIEDVTPNDLRGYSQCHFFAGIGGWSYALRLAGWPDDRPVWTGSCPCQPFSAAGKGKGFDDERHLWPTWYWLIQQCRPAIVFGEQVASKATNVWFDLVQADMEAMGYAFGVVPFPAASIGAPHIRDRAYWVADAGSATSERDSRGILGAQKEVREARDLHGNCADGYKHGGSVVGLGNTEGNGRDTRRAEPSRPERVAAASESCRLALPNNAERGADDTGRNDGNGKDARRPQGAGDAEGCGERCRLADSHGIGRRAARSQRNLEHITVQPSLCHDGEGETDGRLGDSRCGLYAPARPTNGQWRDVDWLFCRDGKWRPVEPGSSPLAHGISNRVGKLRGYGNAIVAPQAAEFIKTVMEAKS